MVTQKLIAEKAGVSFATVSRALTHSAKVRPETMLKIRKAMTELGVSDSEDLFLGRGVLSKMVLVVVGDIATEFFANIIIGIYDILRENGYTMALCNSRYDPETEIQCIRSAEENGYAGIIMITAIESPVLVSFLQNASIPTILVNRYIRSLDLDVVRIDNYRGGYLAAQHLIQSGHRRIAHLAGPRNSAAPQDRLRGFIDAMNDNHVAFGEEDIVYGNLSRECGKQYADWLVSKDYTATYIGNNYMAAGAVHQLIKQGKRIPEEMSIICFDDSPLVNEDGLNLTTISCEPQFMGRSAAETLIKRIADPLGRRIKMILSPQLNERGSVLRRSGLCPPPPPNLFP